MTTLIIMMSAYHQYIESAQVTETEAELLSPIYDLAIDQEFNAAEEAVANLEAPDEIIEIATDIVDTLRYCGTVFMEAQDTEIGLPANWREASVLITAPGKYEDQYLSAEQLLEELNTGREFSRLERRELLARLLITIYKNNISDFTDCAINLELFGDEQDGLIAYAERGELFTDMFWDANNPQQNTRDHEEAACKILSYFSAVFALGLTPLAERVCAEASYGIYEAAEHFAVNNIFDIILEDAGAEEVKTA